MIQLQQEIEASHAGLAEGSGDGYDGSPESIYVFFNSGQAFRRFDVPAYLDTTVSRVRVPIRFVSELMGAKVTWDEGSRQVSIRFPAMSREVLKPVPNPGLSYADIWPAEHAYPDGERYLLEKQTVSTPERRIVLTVEQPRALVDGVEVALDAPPVIREGRTMVPIRFIAEQLSAKVYWVGEQPIFKEPNGTLSGRYQVHIFTPFYPVFEYPDWWLETYGRRF